MQCKLNEIEIPTMEEIISGRKTILDGKYYIDTLREADF
jgi:hypothetical protein